MPVVKGETLIVNVTPTVTLTLTLTLTSTLTYLLICTPRDTILLFSSCSLQKSNHSSYRALISWLWGWACFFPSHTKDLPYPIKNLVSSIKNTEYIIIVPLCLL